MKKFMLVIPFCLLTAISFAQQKKDPLQSLKSILSQVKKSAKNNRVTEKNANERNPQQSNNASSVQDDNGVGSISKDAVFIEADHFYLFNNGAAVIERGSLYAMIDAKGNFIVPYGSKYDFYFSDRRDANTGGLFSVGIKGKADRTCLTSEGKEIKVPGYRFEGLTDDFQYAVFHNVDEGKYMYVDKDNKKFTLDTKLSRLSEGTDYVVTLDNKIHTQKKYRTIYPYSDGMAKVEVVNEFGENKYGFIDKTGKEVIPAIYSGREPSDFKSGLAQVFPRDRTEFDYAYINKKGEVTIKHKGKGFTPFSYSGYAFSADFNKVMNTSGEIILIKDFLASYGIVTNKPGESFSFPEREKDRFVDGHLRFYRKLHPSNKDNLNYGGYINLATHKGVGPAFHYLSDSYMMVFDPVSKLAYARRFVGRDAVDREIWREGYINEEGVFVIVKKEAAKW